MFYDINYSTNIVMNEIGRRLCVRLEINDVNSDLELYLNWDEVFTLPCVKKALNLQYEEEFVRDKGEWVVSLYNEKMDIDEYIRQYVFWNFGDYLK